MRRLFTTRQAHEDGYSETALLRAVRRGAVTRVVQGVYAEGGRPATELEKALALLLATGGVAIGTLAGHLLGLDSVALRPPFVATHASIRPGTKKATLPDLHIVQVDNWRCADGLMTLVTLAAVSNEDTWEQMLESALRKRLVTVSELEAAMPYCSARRLAGTGRMRSVLARRPAGAPATESLLETLAIQLIRREPRLPTPLRQVEVRRPDGGFVARVDLAWPDAGVFLELDGQHHKGQPVYDARRQTAVTAATGWVPGRFTWTEVTQHPAATSRRLVELFEVASRRAA